MSRRVPALVVSGFLGAGKTTLVRHLLAEARREGVRLAVISNEFGALGIDAALLGDPSQDYVELRGGCVCCRLSDELVATLQALHQRARPDRIVVETSGLALPYDTQLNFWRDPVRDWIGDDLAAVVVNAEQLAAGRGLDELFAQQVSSADLLILNQTDRVPPGALAGLEARLREIEPEAPIVRAVGAAVAPELLFPPEPGAMGARGAAAAAPHAHAAYTSEEIEIESGLSEDALRARLGGLDALRVKGFVVTDRGLRVVQGVGPRLELQVPDAAPPDALLGRLVVIRRTRGEVGP
jgi:cobalamin biosynthesis protein CobW